MSVYNQSLNTVEFETFVGQGSMPPYALPPLIAGVVDNLDTVDGQIDMWDSPIKGNLVRLVGNTAIEIVSDTVGDNAIMLVIGLQDDGVGNWVEVTEQVQLNGTTPVSLANTYERVTFVIWLALVNDGTLEVRPIATPLSVQVYMLPKAIFSRKGEISLPTNRVFIPSVFSFSIARATGTSGGAKAGEIVIMSSNNMKEYQELYRVPMGYPNGTSNVVINTPQFFSTGGPVGLFKKRELKFQAVTDNNNSKAFVTVFGMQKDVNP